MSIEYLNTSNEKLGYLHNLMASRASGNTVDPEEYRLLRQHLLNDPLIAPYLPKFVKEHGTIESFWIWIKGKFRSYAERTEYLSDQFSLVKDPVDTPTRPLNFAAQPPVRQSMFTEPQIPTVAQNKRKVFIVHGRDDAAKLEVSRFIEKLGLDAIILHEQASSGMTIIEKIERYSSDADFALVLYTPCDQGKGLHEQYPRDRARQNVVFEHGYLMAKLGRENVCALVKGDIETPNDISGVVYVQLDQAGGWQREVVKELRACGYSVSSW